MSQIHRKTTAPTAPSPPGGYVWRRLADLRGGAVTQSVFLRMSRPAPTRGVRAGWNSAMIRHLFRQMDERRLPPMTPDEQNAIRRELTALRQEHRDLDTAIDAMEATGRADRLTIQRMKKRKLVIKDRMTLLEDRLVPDIIA